MHRARNSSSQRLFTRDDNRKDEATAAGLGVAPVSFRDPYCLIHETQRDGRTRERLQLLCKRR